MYFGLSEDQVFFHDNLKKSAFPYSILSSYENLNKMTTFPSYELFYSNIKNQNVQHLLLQNES